MAELNIVTESKAFLTYKGERIGELQTPPTLHQIQTQGFLLIGRIKMKGDAPELNEPGMMLELHHEEEVVHSTGCHVKSYSQLAATPNVCVLENVELVLHHDIISLTQLPSLSVSIDHSSLPAISAVNIPPSSIWTVERAKPDYDEYEFVVVRATSEKEAKEHAMAFSDDFNEEDLIITEVNPSGDEKIIVSSFNQG